MAVLGSKLLQASNWLRRVDRFNTCCCLMGLTCVKEAAVQQVGGLSFVCFRSLRDFPMESSGLDLVSVLARRSDIWQICDVLLFRCFPFIQPQKVPIDLLNKKPNHCLSVFCAPKVTPLYTLFESILSLHAHINVYNCIGRTIFFGQCCFKLTLAAVSYLSSFAKGSFA